MRPGTPAFVGARLKEAREARGLTAISLAELIGVSRQAVSQYEHGSVTPHPAVMSRITTALNLPYEFFWQPSRSVSGNVFFRTISTGEKNCRIRGNWRVQWLEDIYDYLQEYVQFPPLNLPEFDIPEDIHEITNEMIEAAAQSLRRFWGLGNGAVNNAIRVLEKNGIIVSVDTVSTESIDAFSCWDESHKPCILLNPGPAVKIQIDAAHELGHIILHQNLCGNVMCNAETFKLAEKQAGYFAIAFLLPKETFIKECNCVNLEFLRAMKAKWKVSVAMMLKRAKQLGLCTDEQARNLLKSYSRRGWKEKEPLDDELPITEPDLLRLAFELVMDKGIQTRSDILNNLPISSVDIEQLAGLPEGFFEDEPLVIKLNKDAGEILADDSNDDFSLAGREKRK